MNANNRQLHEDGKAKEKTLAKQLADKAKAGGVKKADGSAYTSADFENAMRSANNSQLGETVSTGMVVPL